MHYMGPRGFAQRYDRLENLMEYGKCKILEADCHIIDSAKMWKTGLAKMAEDPYYFVDKKAKTVSLTASGIAKAEKYFGVENLADAENSTLSHHLNQAMKVLTVITIVLELPTIVFSFYGMNVSDLPFPQTLPALGIAAVLAVTAALILTKSKFYK